MADPAGAQTDGIFAEFNTSMGSYTCRVEYAKAPKASANFIGLATGDRAWLALTTGVVKTEPYFNGQIFHRVIAGFMNQGGSPNGTGTDGPGYSFVDEFDPTLRHDSFGVLSSANSGPDSNGSQFFVTAAPTPWLDDVHTVFGKVVGGSNVVYAINNVATDGNAKPLTNVVLNSVVIRRVGAAAQAFDIHAQGLPDVTALTTSIAKAGTNVSLTFGNQLYVDNRLYSSPDLANWSGTKLGIETAPPVTNSVTLPINSSKQFFRMAQVQYASSTFAPKYLFGKTLTLYFDGYGTNIVTFDSSGGGTYDWSIVTNGIVNSYTWIQEPYNGKLWPIYMQGLYVTTLKLNFTNDSSGSFSGTYYNSANLNLSGVFTLVE
jgi:cyclophilin family peptidyl-prolyl cis-trans isomerase